MTVKNFFIFKRWPTKFLKVASSEDLTVIVNFQRNQEKKKDKINFEWLVA